MKTYLIIGGSSAIAQESIKQLNENGDACIITSRTEQEIFNHPNNSFIKIDVINEEIDAAKIPDQLDGLVYFPGSIQLKPFKSFSPSQYLEDFQLNVIGAVKTLKLSEKALKASGKASIVFFSTVAVQTGLPFHTLVSSSKGAIEGLCRSLAAEWSPDVRVNCIAPSLTDTPLASRLLMNDKQKEAANARHPLGRYGNSVDLANAVCFLLSEQSAWVTGQILNVDGGFSTLKK